jgi:cell division protein FtsB
MSSAPESCPASAPAPAPAAPRSVDIIGKVQRHVDQLRNKNEKLSAEVAKLKTSLAEAKAAGSRIRRIPKKAVAEEAPAPATA